MVTGQEIKEKAEQYIDGRMIVSFIAAGSLLSFLIYGLRKVGMKKAASIVAKVK